MVHHLAQINIARLVAPIGDPRIADFAAQLDPVNRMADAAPGFVWRLLIGFRQRYRHCFR
jgi:hypothetical protein